MTGQQKHAGFFLLMLPKIHFNSWRESPTLTQLELSMCWVYFQSAGSQFHIKVALNFPLILIVWKAKADVLAVDGKKLSRENMGRGLRSSGVHPNTKTYLQALALSLFSERCAEGLCQKGALRLSPSPPAVSETTEIQWDSGQNPNWATRLFCYNTVSINFNCIICINLKLFCGSNRSSSYSFGFLFGFLHIFTVLKKHLFFCAFCAVNPKM